MGPAFLSMPIELILFAATLVGVAIFTSRTFEVAIAGTAAIVLFKLGFAGFDEGTGLAGLSHHIAAEWVILANLGLLLTGFAILSRHFELGGLPDLAPDFLPDGWLGGLTLLALTFVVSGFLDNIAAALIGATVANHVYRGRVHIGFLAAIVAAANAGGAGSVLGDTTTTMMWLAGKSPLNLLHAYVGSAVAFAAFGLIAARMQERYQPILAHSIVERRVDWPRVVLALFILLAAVVANIAVNLLAPGVAGALPVIGIAVWLAILAGTFVRGGDWAVLPDAAKGAVFLLALVFSASLVPVKALPVASAATTLALGFVSAVFDNIPLTALALHQGNYDWSLLAYAVGFGGSMMWFGSSAGVAVANIFPEARSATAWLRGAWWLIPAYVVGFGVAILLLGWRPQD